MKSSLAIIFILFFQVYSFANMNNINTSENQISNNSFQINLLQCNTIKYFDNNGIHIGKPYQYTAGLMAVEFYVLLMLNEHDSDPHIDNFKNAYRDKPRCDDDNALYNFILHPLMGSETYLRARRANYGIPGSIVFSYGASATWEYLIESWTEHPSLQDLIFTSGIGWIFGELRYFLLNNRMSNDLHWLLDPVNIIAEHFYVNVTMVKNGRDYEKKAIGMLSCNI